MVEAGVVGEELARRMAVERNDLTVLTNGFAVPQLLSANETLRVLVCPGTFRPLVARTAGAETIVFLKRYWADLSFVHAEGVVEEGP